MRGLIIAEPWITKILNGEKTWEIRGTATQIRERIGLIRKGSGQVVATAHLTDVVGPLTQDQLIETIEKHGVPEADIPAVLGMYERPHAWVLSNVLPLNLPRPYKHPSGAVIWVILTDGVLPIASDA